MDQLPIYLDYAATTPLDSRVLEAMLPFFQSIFGNPSSIHSFGQKAEGALEESREKVARVLNCKPDEVVFTSCGTESDNLALRGIAFVERARRQANHILISPVEHHAVSRTAEQLAELHGFEVEYLPVDQYGVIQPESVADRIRPTTAIVSTIYANNEIGSINPIAEIGQICRARQIPFHTDAVQAGAYLPLDVQKLNVDLFAIGAHKFYGPKGVGALYHRNRSELHLASMQSGGGQEFGLRAGTHNIPYIVGLASALEIAQAEKTQRIQALLPLCDQLIRQVLANVPDSMLTGHPSQRLPNHASFVFKGVDGNALLMMLDAAGFACSSGSACKTGSPVPSEVLTAISLSSDWALGSLRVTLGVGTNQEQIERFLKVLPTLVERSRQLK